jgi:hypothetical protein
MVKTLRISDNIKTRFDAIQRTESARLNRTLDQTATLEILVDNWEEKEAGVKS